MAFTNFRKETSERSDVTNWAKQSLIRNTPYHYEGIEGCNENDKNVVTHLLERARVSYDGKNDMSPASVLSEIVKLESSQVLIRKINFAKAFGLNLSYVLYCDEVQGVWLYEFQSIDTLVLVNSFSTYIDFSNWINSIKGWKSTKPFRENEDLPLFDKILRRAGCAWPTNIDCFISDENNQPVAILEFQNAKTTSVQEHCNNEFFLCKQEYRDLNGKVKYHDDIRRWVSQEILRAQSDLRLFIITWAQGSEDFILKEVDTITFPELPFAADWNKTAAYKQDMHNYAVTHDQHYGKRIIQNYQSFSLVYQAPIMNKVLHNPPLSAHNKTFPFIYYKYKVFISGHSDQLASYVNSLIGYDKL